MFIFQIKPYLNFLQLVFALILVNIYYIELEIV